MDNKENIIDAEFTEDKSIKYINGKPIYYSTGQVADILCENDSTIRYWCIQFNNILNIKTSGRNRQFTETDIEKLRYIQKLLRKDNFTIKQVQEIATEQQLDLIGNNKVEKDNFMIQAIAKALTIELDNKFQLIQDQLNTSLELKLNEAKQKQSEEINQLKLDLSNKIEENQKLMEAIIKEQNSKAEKRDIELVNSLKQVQEITKRQYELHQKENENKGFFKRLFGK